MQVERRRVFVVEFKEQNRLFLRLGHSRCLIFCLRGAKVRPDDWLRNDRRYPRGHRKLGAFPWNSTTDSFLEAFWE